MTQEEIIEITRQAGFDPHDMSSDFTCNLENINAFAKLVAEKEREACAKIADSAQDDITFIGNMPVTVATAIRARGQA